MNKRPTDKEMMAKMGDMVEIEDDEENPNNHDAAVVRNTLMWVLGLGKEPLQ